MPSARASRPVAPPDPPPQLPRLPGMGGHDQLFKDVLKAFFPEFLALVAPQIREKLGPGEITFLEPETFSDQPRGERRTVDLLARLPPCDEGSPLILAHVEIEREASRLSPERMFRYYLQLRLTHPEPIFPVALFLTGGPGGIGQKIHSELAWGAEVVRFHYTTFGLSQASSEVFMQRPEPLAWALAVLMRRGKRRRWEVKLQALKQLARAPLAPYHRFLLLNLVQTYAKMNALDHAALEQAIQDEPDPEVNEMRLTWADEHYIRGMNDGERKGKLDGKLEGELEGKLSTLKNVTYVLLVNRFGTQVHAIQAQLESLDSVDALEEVFGKALAVQSMEELNAAWDDIARKYRTPEASAHPKPSSP